MEAAVGRRDEAVDETELGRELLALSTAGAGRRTVDEADDERPVDDRVARNGRLAVVTRKAADSMPWRLTDWVDAVRLCDMCCADAPAAGYVGESGGAWSYT